MRGKNQHASWGFEIESKEETSELVRQVHGSKIVRLSDLKQSVEEADGVYCELSRMPAYVFTADCLALLLVKMKGPVVALHMGWRGTMNGILSKAFEILGEDGWTAILGPCLSRCCFEVKSDFIEEFTAVRGDISTYLIPREERFFFDLPKYVIEQEIKGRAKLDLSFLRCTYCSHPKLPSFRRSKNKQTRIRAWVEMT